MLRREYVAHVGRMFQLLGDAERDGEGAGHTVMAIETELARASRKLEDLRDPIKNYNAMALDGRRQAHAIHSLARAPGRGMVTGIDTVVVGQPEFFQQVEKSLRATPLDDWKTYLPLAPRDRLRRARRAGASMRRTSTSTARS